MAQQTLAFGTEVEDIVTGFRGVILGVVNYYDGHKSYIIQSCERDKDGNMRSTETLTEARINPKTIKVNAVDFSAWNNTTQERENGQSQQATRTFQRGSEHGTQQQGGGGHQQNA